MILGADRARGDSHPGPSTKANSRLKRSRKIGSPATSAPATRARSHDSAEVISVDKHLPDAQRTNGTRLCHLLREHELRSLMFRSHDHLTNIGGLDAGEHRETYDVRIEADRALEICDVDGHVADARRHVARPFSSLRPR